MMMLCLITTALSILLLVCESSAGIADKGDDAVTESNHLEDTEDGNEVPVEPKVISAEEEQDGWSAWSGWSPCSRSCSGGVTYQIRKCESKIGCSGEVSRYKICNMQECPDTQDFRASQCAQYNPISYRGRLYEWLPYQDPEAPCSLTCIARSHSFVAKLAPSVKDGTRCREGSLDMCVGGKCLAVGCDLQLGSGKKVDECGVCGGDGSTCRRPSYVWGKTPFSPCSVSCGGGYQMSRPTCLNKANEKEVDERLCDFTGRPVPEIKECNQHKCPPVWVADSWSPCSATCGGGRQSRQVYCAQTDGVRVAVAAEQCLRQRPVSERPCNLAPCPQWTSGPWSGCSVTCGKGHKIRSVACRDVKGQHSEDCDVEVMPITKHECDSGLICTNEEDPGSYLFSDIFKGSQEDAPPRQSYMSPWVKKTAKVSIEPSYVVGEWGPCSTTCGQGFRKRTVDCKIFLEFSRTIATLQDYECPGTKPSTIESCYPRPCSFDLNKPDSERKKLKSNQVGIEVTYSWRSNGFTPCSASCLGGTRESVIQCVRDHDQAVVKATQCDITKKPDAITQTCNDHPCPPKWNITDFSPCSKPCGGGEMTRTVQCLHEVLRGAANTLVVDNSNCPQPVPLEKQFCNVFECPSRWKTEPWSKCSKSCGGGEKIRKIRCMKEKAFGQVVELAPSQCPKHRPKTQKTCNTKPCPDRALGPHKGGIDYVQERPQKTVFLKVGGRAVVFLGANLKIRCPSKNHANKTAILWYKDNKELESSKRMKISMKGALRIRKVNLKDSGKYTCASDLSKEDIFITVTPMTHIPPKINEDRTVESLQPSVTATKNKDHTSEERFSHEKGRVPTDDKPFLTIVKGDRSKIPQLPKVDYANSVENTVEENRRQYHYKPSLHSNQDSHQDVRNIRTTEKPSSLPSPTVKPLDSDELVPLRGQHDTDKNRQRLKSKTYGGSTSEERMPNQVLPPPPPNRYGGDTWRQTYDGALIAKNKHKEMYDRNNDLVSDQEELNVGTPHDGKGLPGSVQSSASSIHSSSHIKNLLMHLPTLGVSSPRKDDLDDYDDGEGRLDGGDEPLDEEMPRSVFPTMREMSAANSVVLGKGNADSLVFDWVISDWTACSQSCRSNGAGYQVRSAQCMVSLNNVSKPVDATLCEDAGFPTPTTQQSCGHHECPHWETAPWSQCLETHCFTWHTSHERRAVFCRGPDGADLPHSQCDEKTRPRRKRECYNSKCRSTWKVGEWSECTAPCGRTGGFQSRILQCVWFGSTRPAGNACRDQQRPIVLRPCTGRPCPSSDRQLH
ncbi:hypothetical protein JTE90_026909 [Oedothorax gibbosus]|uniref:Ig-like domain-containing protein n=1 Tax=Oedothorax gibbosus TaxID=931172 RepID=A0AAV6UD44_9ARAC|nr:hypothetical protein JTE90_026909 [Oedothorax gibbosus]